MTWLSALFTDTASVAHIVLVYALVIACGSFFGRLRVAGISLGVTFVLFAGLAAGYLGLAVPPGILTFVRDFGLTLFIFFIGLQVGPSFFSSFKSGGLLLNLLTVLLVCLGVAVTIALWYLTDDGISLPLMLGVHFGAVTNTPGLGATQEALDLLGYAGENIAVAYACAYPLGVMGIILCALLIRLFFGVNLSEEDRQWEAAEKEQNHEPVFFHVEVCNEALSGHAIGDIRSTVGRAFICSRVQSDGRLYSPNADTVLRTGDVVRIVAAPEDEQAIAVFFGKRRDDVDLAAEKSPILTRQIIITQPRYNGMRVRDLHLNQYDGVNITRIFRAGMTLYPYSNMHLQVGDQLYCVGSESALQRMETMLGNKIKKLYHPNIMTIFVGLALGIIAGSIPLAVPGMPAPLKLGLAGGPLIVAIILGRFGSRFRLITYTTQSASLMIRELGISLFLASVGLGAGESFVHAMLDGSGLTYAGLGFLITVIPLLTVGIVARKCFRINYHSIVGLMAGATTDPPALAYAATLSEKNASAISYSTVYPLAMFLRILTGQLILVALWQF